MLLWARILLMATKQDLVKKEGKDIFSLKVRQWLSSLSIGQ